MEPCTAANGNDLELRSEPPDVLSILGTIAVAATIAANYPISQQIAEKATHELNKAQATITNWLDSLSKSGQR